MELNLPKAEDTDYIAEEYIGDDDNLRDNAEPHSNLPAGRGFTGDSHGVQENEPHKQDGFGSPYGK